MAVSSSPNTHLHPVTYEVREGESSVAGMKASEMAKKLGTPLYLLDEATLTTTIKAYQDAFKGYPAPIQMLFAAKANLSMGLCAFVAKHGLGIDVVSGGEYYTALKAGFPLEKILFNGNNKSKEELTLAIHHGAGWISVDNLYELSLVDEIAKTQGKKVDILLRVTPGIECHTHDYIRTGHLDSKFGFNLSQLDDVMKTIQSQYQNTINLKGLHAHIGSQIFETTPYADLVDVMLGLYDRIRKEYGITCTHLNLGGGLGIAYQESDDPPDIAVYAKIVVDQILKTAKQIDYPLPTLLLEPGRSLVATSGCTLYTVGSIKTIPELNKTYVAVDGGMGDNIRPALYGAVYSAIIANKANEPHTKKVTIAGKYCESGDVLIKEFLVPESIQPGDLLMVFATGAYNYSMSSNYNRVPRPAMVMLKDGKAETLVARETYDDLIARDLILQHV